VEAFGIDKKSGHGDLLGVAEPSKRLGLSGARKEAGQS
jgi:hypothetical protein